MQHFFSSNSNRLIYFLTPLILTFFLSLFVIISPYVGYNHYFGFNKKLISDDIIVVGIDEKTLNSTNFKRYQDINRADYATLIQNILNQDPKVVGLDIVFSQKGDNELADQQLVKILSSNDNVVMGTEYLEKEKRPLLDELIKVKEGYSNIGYVNITSKNDTDFFNSEFQEYKNKIPLYDNTNILPLSFKVYSKYLGQELTLKDIPLQDSFFNINHFSSNFKTVSFIDVLENKIDYGIFKNKIVLVGATAEDIHDTFYTPAEKSNMIPGVFIHANGINTLLTKKFITFENFYQFTIFTYLILLLLFWILLSTTFAKTGVLYSFLSLLGLITIEFILFLQIGFVSEYIPIIIAWVLLVGVAFMIRYLGEKKAKDQVKELFGKYISPEVVTEIIKIGLDNLKLGGQRKELSIFFSDIEGFTSLSEKLEPEELSRILNLYLDKMSKVILKHKGTIDKYIGDAIMAFWNAPLKLEKHAEASCYSAIEQQLVIKEVNKEIQKTVPTVSIGMRIGINSGIAVVGNFGTLEKINYTIIGDSVNLASRLEGINKFYGTHIIISENTYKLLKDKEQFVVRELDLIKVKGKTEPITIFELKGLKKQVENNSDYIKFKEDYEKAFKLYKERKFDDAINLFSKYPEDKGCKMFLERCEYLKTNPPEEGWKGDYKFEVKG